MQNESYEIRVVNHEIALPLNLGKEVVIVRSPKRVQTIAVYSLDNWQKKQEEFQLLVVTNPDVRTFLRLFNRSAVLVMVKNGKIQIPQYLLDYAEIKSSVIITASNGEVLIQASQKQ